MRRATLLALFLVAGVALAQNPFRDLAPAPEPEPEVTVNEPITIDIPEAPLPAPPTDITGFPALPAPGAYDGSSSAPESNVFGVNLPDQPIVFALPEISFEQDDTRAVALRNPLHVSGGERAHPLLQPLAAPEPAPEEPMGEPEATGEEESPLCVDAAVLATSGGVAPTALIRCDGATHLLRVGDAIPGTDATIESINALGVTLTREGQDHQLHIAAN